MLMRKSAWLIASATGFCYMQLAAAVGDFVILKFLEIILRILFGFLLSSIAGTGESRVYFVLAKKIYIV